MGVAEERYESEFFRSLYRDAHNEGLEQGLQAGREQGEAHAMKQALRALIEARSFALKLEHDARIDDCVDLGTLQRWHRKAATADSVADVFR